MAHTHGHLNQEVKEQNLLISIFLNFGITIVEFIGGIFSNSLALVSDAFHNLSDAMALLISYIAMKLGRRPSDQKKTFGYKRIEILAALFNGVVLIAISIYLFFEAYERFMDPRPINDTVMLVVASFGLLANLISVLLLRKDSRRNLNVRAAYLHLLGDTLSSVGVIIGALIIRFWQVTWIDPLLTILIGLFIIKETYSIIKETISILMESVPEGFDMDAIRAEMENDMRIDNVHHIHIWKLSDQQVHFECHVDFCKDQPLSEADSIRQELEDMLIKKFDIQHVTIQMEYDACSDKEMIHKS